MDDSRKLLESPTLSSDRSSTIFGDGLRLGGNTGDMGGSEMLPRVDTNRGVDGSVGSSISPRVDAVEGVDDFGGSTILSNAQTRGCVDDVSVSTRAPLAGNASLPVASNNTQDIGEGTAE